MQMVLTTKRHYMYAFQSVPVFTVVRADVRRGECQPTGFILLSEIYLCKLLLRFVSLELLLGLSTSDATALY